ncbi:Hypothetical predicted protein [Olea europaea subsp. europaea]|uniref:R13L1/DRL21-like LRR repeat region domain-containing protein n=1 Tax=Olea europaea subsp. europaea TaxID=158383 RepID=A0A8S0UZJ7_OLEEU|nr:Hypothetical predicted protein [Olea europaea subsp. europaea]
MIESIRCLEDLRVTQCDKLVSISIDLGELPCISRLEISFCSELRNLPKGICRHSNLTKLTIGRFSKSIDFNSFQTVLDGIEQSKSLRDLSLHGWEHWDSLPYQLQHLTSLESLTLFGFGMEALPEWFGGLSSLSTLYLNSCHKLRHLPSEEAMQRLKKLQQLVVIGCPLFQKMHREENGPDSELSKISNVPHLWSWPNL